MNSYALDETGWDLHLDADNHIARTYGTDRVAQNLKERLHFFQDDWFLNRNVGLPYFQEILTRPANIPLVEAEYKTEILNTPGVDALAAFTIGLDAARGLTVQFCVEADDVAIEETICLEST